VLLPACPGAAPGPRRSRTGATGSASNPAAQGPSQVPFHQGSPYCNANSKLLMLKLVCSHQIFRYSLSASPGKPFLPPLDDGQSTREAAPSPRPQTEEMPRPRPGQRATLPAEPWQLRAGERGQAGPGDGAHGKSDGVGRGNGGLSTPVPRRGELSPMTLRREGRSGSADR